MNTKIEFIHEKLKQLVKQFKKKFMLIGQIKEYDTEIEGILDKTQQELKQLPVELGQLKETLEEMTKDTLPDKSADYWEEKEMIAKSLAELEIVTSNLKESAQYFEMTASKHHLKDKYKSARDNETLQTICDEHKDLSAEIEEKANQIFEM